MELIITILLTLHDYSNDLTALVTFKFNAMCSSPISNIHKMSFVREFGRNPKAIFNPKLFSSQVFNLKLHSADIKLDS